MHLELNKCPNCQGAIQFADDSTVTTCAFCNYQVRLAPDRSAFVRLRLAESLQVAVLGTEVGLVSDGRELPYEFTYPLVVSPGKQANLEFMFFATAKSATERTTPAPSSKPSFFGAASVSSPVETRRDLGGGRLVLSHIRESTAEVALVVISINADGSGNVKVVESGAQDNLVRCEFQLATKA